MNYRDYQNSRDAAWRLLIDCDICTLPVMVTAICHQIGVRVLRDKELDAPGKTMILRGQPCIFIRPSGLLARDRFTAAHELGHIVLGHIGRWPLINREPSPTDNPIEQAANIFAARLLAPACVLWGCKVQTAEEIQALCQISRRAAECRMERMKELYHRGRFLSSPLEREVYHQFEEFIKDHQFPAD